MKARTQRSEAVELFDGPYYLSIAGKLVGAADSFEVMNPATGAVLAMAEPEVDQSISWIRQIAARRIPVEIVEETDSHIVVDAFVDYARQQKMGDSDVAVVVHERKSPVSRAFSLFGTSMIRRGPCLSA